MIRSIRTLILIALLAFLFSALLEETSPQDERLFDSFFTLLLLGVLWFNLRHRLQRKQDQPGAPSPTPSNKVEGTGARANTPSPVAPPRKEVALPSTLHGLPLIYHQPPWTVVERGQVLGRFRNARIPSWIRTSDKRTADYVGVQTLTYPDHCPCIEIPERSELILPPGMVYTIRPS